MESVFEEERIEQIHVYNYKLSRKLAMLMLAASKANNKKLVQRWRNIPNLIQMP